jgi:hypothetical protein
MTTHRHIISSAAVAVAVAVAFAMGTAPALAQPLVPDGGPYVRQEKQLVSPRSKSVSPTIVSGSYVAQEKRVIGASSPSTAPSTGPSIVRVSPASGGFDWGDAGIGAAGGFALSMLGIGGALVLTQRRTRGGETALTS